MAYPDILFQDPLQAADERGDDKDIDEKPVESSEGIQLKREKICEAKVTQLEYVLFLPVGKTERRV